jgi:pyruvate dehydrogenase E1 component alpha subunit
MQVAAESPPKQTSTDAYLRAVGDDGTLAPAFSAEAARLVELWRGVARLRRLSQRLVALQREGKISSHASPVGEEGALVGAALALADTDWVFPSAREALVSTLRGVGVDAYVHHAFGDARDPLEGRVPPDHLCSRASRVAPPSGTLGGHLTHAVGCAWAMRGDGAIALAFLDGAAASTGHFHDALNFAGVFRAPVVFVCRNDGRRDVDVATVGGLAGKAVGYGIASAQVDGSDAVAVLAVVSEAAARARSGEGASLVEVLTSPPLDGTLDVASDRDPLLTLERAIDRAGGDASRAKTLGEIDEELARAAAATVGAGTAPRGSIFDNVYSELPGHLRAQKGRP